MLRQRHFLLLVTLVLASLGSGLASAAQESATALVERTTMRMLDTLEQRRAEIERDPSLIYGLLEDQVAPHFDFVRITQGAVGRYWREASQAQRQRLVDSFKQVLIRTYARSLLSYSGEEIRYLPVRPSSRPNRVTVATEVQQSGGSPIPVDYRMYDGGSGWKVYDVVISNASLVGNYRSDFATEIRRSGIDGLIARLEDMNLKGRE
ncbi:toluene tolerance protein [Marichromatium purpuratum 984]|uniref:Toluene tolerance protein n=1 Tax=Marichromatium purpuratum 984 TaxID=765910 RepID=W0DVX0_MARPU|nr:ABC transporter substrate-binding protein [Marichromatium purpuratum]AHF02715.1 toluene tolerance protein [Marichromatium purpuratum 984]